MKNSITIECTEITCTSTVKRGEDNAHIKMTLENVRVTELMVSVINEIGVDGVLDHISDLQISNYLKAAR